MTIKDLFNETQTALSANKVRSGLTILGIVIGISSVIALVSIGQGATSSIQSSIQSLGSNLIEVMPGAPRTQGFAVSAGRGGAKSLTQEDADAILTQVANVKAVAPEVSGRYQIAARGTNTNTTVDGTTSGYLQIRNVSIDQGSFVTDQQTNTYAKVAVLGPTTAADLFGTDDSTQDGLPDGIVGQTIRINNMDFTVVGITVSKGTSGFNNQDDVVYVPATTAERYLSGSKYLTTIDVEAATPDAMTQVQNDLTNLLLAQHNIADPTQADFNVLNQADVLSSVSNVSATLTLLLAAISGISLLVGGIGIMNMMLTTVTERTREIGLRKAIGATQKDITAQFLCEAIALTLIGGTIGILLGSAISLGAGRLGLISTSLSWQSIAIAFGVSGAIGICFGYYPARRASLLNPIEALRYE